MNTDVFEDDEGKLYCAMIETEDGLQVEVQCDNEFPKTHTVYPLSQGWDALGLMHVGHVYVNPPPYNEE